MSGWSRGRLASRLFLLSALVVLLHSLTLFVLLRSGNGTLQALIAYGVFSAFLWVALSLWLIERAIVRPLQKLSAEIDRFSRPDYTPTNDSSDLVSLLSHGMHRLVVRVRDDARNLADQQSELRTAKQQLNRAEQLALVGQLSAGLAHEIGNPLGAVMGYMKLLEDEDDAETRKELAARSENELQRIHRLVRELLDFARPAALHITPVALAPVLQESANLLSHQTRAKHCEVIASPTVEWVHADPDRLKQVLLNLLLNAADAMQGRGKIAVDVTSEGPNVAIRIADQGPGFSESALQHAFEPFFTTKKTGSGLGLAVCKTLSERMGGTLELQNEQVGASVTLTLRLARDPAKN